MPINWEQEKSSVNLCGDCYRLGKEDPCNGSCFSETNHLHKQNRSAHILNEIGKAEAEIAELENRLNELKNEQTNLNNPDLFK